MRQENQASPCIEGGIRWFFLDLWWKFGVRLKLRWGSQGTSHVASGMSGLFSKCEGHLGITLDWMQGPRASSQVEGENLEVFLELQQEVWRSSRLVSQGTSGVAKRESNFLLICEGEHRIALE